MRHDDDRVHPALCRIGQGCDHIIIEHQIRGHNVHIFFCLIDNIQIKLVSHRFPVDRAVRKRDRKSVHVKLRRMEIIPGIKIWAVIKIRIRLF